MLLTAIELQGGQANIEGMSYRSPYRRAPTFPDCSPALRKSYYEVLFLFFRFGHGNDNKKGLKFILKLSRDFLINNFKANKWLLSVKQAVLTFWLGHVRSPRVTAKPKMSANKVFLIKLVSRLQQ